MFERRLKWMGLVLAALTVLLVGRLLQVQVFGRTHYRDLATEVMTQQRAIPTTRGPILDVRGRVIAEDRACIDAAVDFRAVTRDLSQPYVKSWVRRIALQRLRNRTDGAWTAPGANRKQLLEQELQQVQADIDAMWQTLDRIGRQTGDDIDDIRTRIEQEVRMKKRHITHARYRSAVAEAESQPKPTWYQRWLTGGGDNFPTEDEFDDELIYEQQSPHVVLRAIPPEIQNELGRQLDTLPGLSLVPSTHRVYPYGHHAAHVIGYLGKVQSDDLLDDPQTDDDLRRYQPNELVGRSGIEALAEQILRGARGKEEMGGDGGWGSSSRVDPVPGRSVTSTIDIELQAQIRDLFTRVQIPHPDREHKEVQVSEMHGAAVVIDIPTGEVRALVSYPDYDLNRFAELYRAMRLDEGNKPLLNRATMAQLEPGSTVKPLVGLAAIAEGKSSLADRIECDGYLHLRGRKWGNGRCWTASVDSIVHVHHQIPYDDPHVGPTAELKGHLNFSEAIQRSCNIYFENMADRLGGDKLAEWFERFGVGRYTGLGIPEAHGTVPRGLTGPARLFATWISGIGQGSVLATPLQVTTAVAAVARGGVWVRPTLLREQNNLTPWQPRGGANHKVWPDRYDLQLPPDALAAAQRGMVAVVETRAGSGSVLRRPDVRIAAKTGTAEAEKFRPIQLDEEGKPVLDAAGRRVRQSPRPGTWHAPNPEYPWYRASDLEGKKLHHAWMVGFAPADNPQIAFAVMVEYGGAGGGAVAGPIAKDLLEACVEHGYIRRRAE